MKVLFDTSVLVSGIVEAHPMHSRCLPWLQRAKAGDFEFLVVSHSLAETYAVLTTLPVRPRISPALALRLVHSNIEEPARVIPLTIADCRATIKRMAKMGFSGGTVYDALIASAARRMSVERLLTLNGNDFHRIWPEGNNIIGVP